MKEKEEIKTQVGIFNLPGNMAFPNDKVIQLFTKLKRKADQMETTSPSLVYESGQVTPLKEIEPNIAELQQRAMNSYSVGPDVVKTERGFEVV